MAFADEVVKEGRGRVIRLDFSTDKFSTIAFRISDVAGKMDGVYSGRLVSMSRIARAFGQDRIAAGARFDVTLDNTDGLFDTWFNRANVNTTFALQCRVYVTLYDPATSPSSFASQQLGQFAARRFSRNNSHVTVVLEDDMLARLSEGIQLPTIGDWAATGSAATNCLINDSSEVGGTGETRISMPPDMNIDSPIPLVFGLDWVELPGPLLAMVPAETFWEQSVIPLCARVDTTLHAGEVTELRALVKYDGREEPVDIPRTFQNGAATLTLWSEHVSGTISKDGFTWVVLCILVRNSLLWEHFSRKGYGHETVHGDGREFYSSSYLGGTAKTEDGSNLPVYTGHGLSVPASVRLFAKGSVWSGTESDAKNFHPMYVLKDLAEDYTKNGPTVASFAATYAGCVDAQVVGKISDGTVRAAITGIAQSCDFDAFINNAGELDFCLSTWTAALAIELAAAAADKSFPIIYEHEVANVEEWFPEDGERGAFANKYFNEGTRPNDADQMPEPPRGPFIYTSQYANTYAVAPETRLVERRIQCSWLPFAKTTDHPFPTRALQLEVVPRIRFRTGIAALRLDLGDFFYFSWSRGLSPVAYETDLFQVEAIAYDASTDTVDVEAIFRRDMGRKGYLLDNQAMRLITSDATFAGDPSVTDASTTVNFSAGNLTSSGVLAGDLLVLLDATLATGIYTRFRAVRIVSVNSATQVTIASDDLDFDAGAPTAVTTWKILRGAITAMATADYPSGDYYGKASTEIDQSSAGVTSGALTGG